MMATTVENRMATDAKVLQSYLGGKWQSGGGQGTPLRIPQRGDRRLGNFEGLDLLPRWGTPAMWEAQSCAS